MVTALRRRRRRPQETEALQAVRHAASRRREVCDLVQRLADILAARRQEKAK